MKNSCVMILFVILSCKPSVPNKIIQPSRLEQILYDIHVADGYALNESGDFDKLASRRMEYRQAVLSKHNISPQQLDESMEYYYRHSEKLQQIYENISKRLSKDIKSVGGDVYEAKKTFALGSDTANIWIGSDHKVLLPYTFGNREEFVITADSSYHKGDVFVFMFRSQYVLQEGSRDALAMLNIKLDNDSVISRVQHVGTDGDYNIRIGLPDDRNAKSINGFIFMANGGIREGLTTLKMLNLYQISLLRIHNQAKHNHKLLQDSLTIYDERPKR